MSENSSFHSSNEAPAPGYSHLSSGEAPPSKVEGSLFQNKRFRWAWGVSIFLHVVIFGAAAWSPSSANYRFFGSGTAVSLVGVDEIPGGSSRGKSGDRPEDVQVSSTKGTGKSKQISARIKKKSKKKIKRAKKKPTSKKDARKLAIKKKKKKISKRRQERLKRIKVRRERLKKWRKKQVKRKKDVKNVKLTSAKKPKKIIEGNGKQVMAKNTAGERPKSKVGHPGEGGGDGQGGGSLGGGSGGVARTELGRYYGLINERVRSFWVVPPNLNELEHLKAIVIFDVSLEGAIRGLRIEKSSGNSIFDRAALRAVEKAANPSFPIPPASIKEKLLSFGLRICGRQKGC